MNDQNNPQLPFTKRMFVTLQVEEAAITGVAIYFLTRHSLGLSIWVWIPLFFSPDISTLGYLAGNRAGAFTYNLFHNRAISLLIATAGFLLHQEVMITIGILLFAHSSFDRMLGYGLKHDDAFNNTHLGRMGKNELR
jgi:hypothetical protein